MAEISTKSRKETQKVAKLLVKKVKQLNTKRAYVIALEGELGSGKTTFVQGFARAFGIKTPVQSPTFVLMKAYTLNSPQKFKHLIHIDCYRLNSPQELLHLGFRDILHDKDAIILIEWADRVRGLIPKTALWIKFKHRKKPHERVIKTNERELTANKHESRILKIYSRFVKISY